MTTKLDSPVRRETSIVINGRLGNVTLLPAEPERGLPDSLEVHLKDTQQRKRIPLTVIFESVWPQKARAPRSAAGELDVDLDELERALAPWRETS
jgi:hypothetical protein